MSRKDNDKNNDKNEYNNPQNNDIGGHASNENSNSVNGDAKKQHEENNPFEKMKDLADKYKGDDKKGMFGKESPKDSSNNEASKGLKDKAKDKAKDEGKEMAKKMAKKGVKDAVKKGGATAGAGAGAEGGVPVAGGVAAGGVLGALGIKALSAVVGVARGILNSLPVSILQSIVGLGTKALAGLSKIGTGAVGLVNGAINGAMSVIGVTASVTSVIPTVIVATVVTVSGIITPIIFNPVDEDCIVILKDAKGSERTGTITSDIRQKLIDTAMIAVNNKVPYVWGGNDWENGMDCSGFMKIVFEKAASINLQRTAALQSTMVTKIAEKEAQEGDLVFWGGVGESTHVAMYKGNGEIIEEPQPGKTAQVRKLSLATYDKGAWFGALDVVAKEDSKDVANTTQSGGSGDYNVKGSAKYKVAETIWNELVDKHGFSGAGAAGAIGNAVRESRLDPKADNPAGGVHGVFQWSGWPNGDSQFANGNRWGAAPEGLKDTLSNEIALMNLELNGAYKVRVKERVGKQTDVGTAAHLWALKYEGLPGSEDNQTYAKGVTFEGAKWAYSEFGGASIKADESLIGSSADSSASNNSAISQNEDEKSSKSNEVNGCANPDDESESSSTGGGEPDGSGAVSTAYGFFRYNQVPEELKPYVHDPRDVGMKYGSSTGWYNPGGQCVHLASSYFHAIWEGSPDTVRYPGGGDATKAWASAMGGEVSKVPKAGAIASVPPYTANQSNSKWGHTFVVQHVFENGDILLIETNVTGYSGDDNGEKNTWSYRLMPKEHYKNGNFTFYSPPDGDKYKLKW